MVQWSGEDFIFRMVLVGLYSLYTIVRIYYRIKTKNSTPISERNGTTQKLLLAMMIYEVLSFIAFVFLYEWIPWDIAHISYPVWVRIIGIPIGVGSIVYFVFIHQALGKNFSPKLEIKNEQTLVTSGPYKRIRHPMYLAFVLLHIAVFLIVANWIIGITWNLFLVIIIAIRVKPEESMLLEKFGKQYAEYMKETGRFFPKLKKKL